MDGFYEEALVMLSELSRIHPNAFNLDFPRLQCLKRLGRFEEVKELYGSMTVTYAQPDQQEKLRQVGEWITAQEGSGFDGLGGIDLGVDPTILGTDLMGDLLGLSEPRKSVAQARRSSQPAEKSHQKAIAAIVLIGTIVAASIFILPAVLKPMPQFSAGVVVGLPFSSIEGKFFRKTGRINRTELMGQIVIINEDKIYVMIPEERKYSVSGAEEVMGNSFFSEISDIDKWAAARNVKKVGQEVLYGLKCDIYQGRLSLNPARPTSDMKVWYSPDLDFPVKSESASSGLLGRVVIFLTDIRIGPLPDTLFTVPAGYTLVSAQETKELGGSMGIGFGPGMGGDSYSPPSSMHTPLPAPGVGMPPPSSGSGAPDNSKSIDPQAMQQLMQQFDAQN